MAALEFWYEFGSTYSYPAAMRIEPLAEEAGVELRWRPFLLGPIFKAYGWNDSPFNIFEAKGRYMWRDLTRICEGERTSAQAPAGALPAERAEGGAARLWSARGRAGRRLHPRRVHGQLRRAERYQRRRDVGRHPRRRLASTRKPRSPRRTRFPSKTGSSSRPRRRRGAASSARRPSPSAMSCSGATTASRRRSPGQAAYTAQEMVGKELLAAIDVRISQSFALRGQADIAVSQIDKAEKLQHLNDGKEVVHFHLQSAARSGRSALPL